MTSTLLCQTVNGDSMAEILEARDAATLGDMVELRLDGVADLSVAGVLAGRRCPAIVTCRPAWEGGRFGGDERTRATVLARALELGAEFVDIEWRALSGAGGPQLVALIARAPHRVVLSMHDFGGVPADLSDMARAMRATGAGVIKIAVAAARLSDSLPLLDVARGGDAVVIGMGEAGLPSRLLAARYGSRWTYAGNGVAPGQIPADRMIEEFRFRRVGRTTRVFGVVGSNAAHSLSPVMHNAALDASGIDAVYVPLRASDFDDFLEYAAAIGIEGASVTIPFKVDALHAASAADDLTRHIGAANTLRRRGRHDREAAPADHRRTGPEPLWEATNTDVEGFLSPLDDVLTRSLEGTRASVLGAGGAARAVVVGLLSRGARVTVHAWRSEQALRIAADTGAAAGPWPPAAGWDLLVNCTPLGGAGRRDESPLPGGPFSGSVVYDLTYGSGASRLLREAAAAGCVTIDGLPMLVAQAERQFEWWMGRRPGPGVMAGAARRRQTAAEPAAAKVQ